MKPNPAPSITPLGWFALAGIAVATVVLLTTKKAKSEETATACAIDVTKLHAWGLSKSRPVLYLQNATTAPTLPALAAQGVSAAELAQDFVVVLKDGSFWEYPEETPVAAPSLRAEYCATL